MCYEKTLRKDANFQRKESLAKPKERHTPIELWGRVE